MNESKFITKVHKSLPSSVYKVKIADKFARGIPDTWYSGPAGDLWVEYKYQEKLGTKPNLSDLQQKWLVDRCAEGRNVACVVGSESGVAIYEGTSWVNYKSYTPVSFKEYIDWIMSKTA